MNFLMLGMAVFLCTLVAVAAGAIISRPSQPVQPPMPSPQAAEVDSDSSPNMVTPSELESTPSPPPPKRKVTAFQGADEVFDILSAPPGIQTKIPEKNRVDADEFYDELRHELDDTAGA